MMDTLRPASSVHAHPNSSEYTLVRVPSSQSLSSTTSSSGDEAELRVLIVTPCYYIMDGVSITMRRVVTHLKNKGIPVLVITTEPLDKRLAEVDEDHVYTVRAVGSSCGYRVPRSLDRRAYAKLEKFRPTIVHVTSPDMCSFTAVSWAKRRNIPNICTWHSNFDLYLKHHSTEVLFSPFIHFWIRLFYGNVPLTLVPTERDATRLAEDLSLSTPGVLCNGTRIKTWGRGVNSATFSPTRRSQIFRDKLGIAPDEVVVLWCGRLVKEKRPDVWLQAIRRLIDAGISCRGLVVGRAMLGNENFAEEMQETLGDALLWTGWLEGTQLAEAYASADVFLFPSTVETFGNVTLEAMSSGVPCIVDKTCSGHLVQDGCEGFLASVDEPDTYFDALMRLARDPELRASMGAAGRATAAARWSLDANNDKMVKYWQNEMNFHQDNSITAVYAFFALLCDVVSFAVIAFFDTAHVARLVLFPCFRRHLEGAEHSHLSPTGKGLEDAREWRPVTINLFRVLLYLVAILGLSGSTVDDAAIARSLVSAGLEDYGIAGAAGTNDARTFTTIVTGRTGNANAVERAVAHYSSCPSVEDVVVMWGGDEQSAKSLSDRLSSATLSVSRSSVRVEPRIEKRSNDNFNLTGIDTSPGLFVVDQYKIVPCKDVELAFLEWLVNPRQLVGLSPISLRTSFDGRNVEAVRMVFGKGPFVMVESDSMFVARRWADLYQRPRYRAIREYVGIHESCEDLALAMLVANSTRSGPVWVQSSRADTLQEQSGRSHGVRSIERRINSECLHAFTSIFGRSVLRESFKVISRTRGFAEMVHDRWLDMKYFSISRRWKDWEAVVIHRGRHVPPVVPFTDTTGALSTPSKRPTGTSILPAWLLRLLALLVFI